jgi:hypothetical protein
VCLPTLATPDTRTAECKEVISIKRAILMCKQVSDGPIRAVYAVHIGCKIPYMTVNFVNSLPKNRIYMVLASPMCIRCMITICRISCLKFEQPSVRVQFWVQP